MNVSFLKKTAFAGLASLVIGGFASECNLSDKNHYLMKDSNISQGVYECEAGQQNYKFNSEEPESKFLWRRGDEKGIEFNDLLTGDEVRLTEDQDYICDLVGRNEKNDKNWVSINIWDSFYPLGMDKTIPESLMALEVIFYQYYKYNAMRNFKELLGVDYEPLHGKRSRESHYMLWIHFSDDFLKEYPINRSEVGEELFMYPDRETDLFVGWGGNVDILEFILNGVRGLTTPVPGSFHGFQVAVDSGNPDFEGGFLITDEQAKEGLKLFKTYSGLTNGFSFLSKKGEDTCFESKLAEGVQGDNCGHCTYTFLDMVGFVDKERGEKHKKCMWYAEGFWDNPVPLDILDVGSLGIDLGIFDEEKLTSHIFQRLPGYRCVRIWEPVSSINEFENFTFKTKRVVEELLPSVLLRSQITNPFPNGLDRYRFRDTEEYQKYLAEGHEMMQEKREKAGLVGKRLEDLLYLEKIHKAEFLKTIPIKTGK